MDAFIYNDNGCTVVDFTRGNPNELHHKVSAVYSDDGRLVIMGIKARMVHTDTYKYNGNPLQVGQVESKHIVWGRRKHIFWGLLHYETKDHVEKGWVELRRKWNEELPTIIKTRNWRIVHTYETEAQYKSENKPA